MPCSPVEICRRFGVTCCLHYQRRKASRATKWTVLTRHSLFYILFSWLTFDAEDRGSRFLRNVDKIVSTYMPLHLHSHQVRTSISHYILSLFQATTRMLKIKHQFSYADLNWYVTATSNCAYSSKPGLEVLTAVDMKISGFWDTTSCSTLKVNRCFGRTYSLHIQGRSVSQASCCLLGLLLDP
jgi:hypothetical protein